eukprot:TRINITY_DN1626_c0_g1_i3.p1 TRINITY_DN1626_c0_g1~~TRINITY_DN1626_c0_g1_i3.p1  ORF type:complete len:806 (+),score=266.79 TRINITY_DN1626_c0_g1_i3:277-2418(+)
MAAQSSMDSDIGDGGSSGVEAVAARASTAASAQDMAVQGSSSSHDSDECSAGDANGDGTSAMTAFAQAALGGYLVVAPSALLSLLYYPEMASIGMLCAAVWPLALSPPQCMALVSVAALVVIILLVWAMKAWRSLGWRGQRGVWLTVLTWGMVTAAAYMALDAELHPMLQVVQFYLVFKVDALWIWALCISDTTVSLIHATITTTHSALCLLASSLKRECRVVFWYNRRVQNAGPRWRRGGRSIGLGRLRCGRCRLPSRQQIIDAAQQAQEAARLAALAAAAVAADNVGFIDKTWTSLRTAGKRVADGIRFARSQMWCRLCFWVHLVPAAEAAEALAAQAHAAEGAAAALQADGERHHRTAVLMDGTARRQRRRADRATQRAECAERREAATRERELAALRDTVATKRDLKKRTAEAEAAAKARDAAVEAKLANARRFGGCCMSRRAAEAESRAKAAESKAAAAEAAEALAERRAIAEQGSAATARRKQQWAEERAATAQRRAVAADASCAAETARADGLQQLLSTAQREKEEVEARFAEQQGLLSTVQQEKEALQAKCERKEEVITHLRMVLAQLNPALEHQTRRVAALEAALGAQSAAGAGVAWSAEDAAALAQVHENLDSLETRLSQGGAAPADAASDAAAGARSDGDNDQQDDARSDVGEAELADAAEVAAAETSENAAAAERAADQQASAVAGAAAAQRTLLTLLQWR